VTFGLYPFLNQREVFDMWHPQFQFPEHLKEASVSERLVYFEKGFVLKHMMIQCTQDELRSSFFESKEQQIALVVGPTGVGKSCLANAIFKESYREVVNESPINKLPMVYFEPDVHSSGGFSWKDFYSRLLAAIGELEETRVYGRPLPVGEHGARKYSTRGRSEYELRKDLEQRIIDYGVKYILFDEIQHIFKYGGKAAERSLDILKNISNKTSCRFIGLGTYEVSFSVEKSAQLSRRIMTLEFPGYSFEVESEFKQFLSAYNGLLAHMPVEMSPNITEYIKDAYVGCCGCVGILKEWFNRALLRALREDSELTTSHFQDTRLKGSQLRSVAEEIREGRILFAEPKDDEILSLLRGEEQMGLGAIDEKTVVRRNSKPGVRKPKRDKVG